MASLTLMPSVKVGIAAPSDGSLFFFFFSLDDDFGLLDDELASSDPESYQEGSSWAFLPEPSPDSSSFSAERAEGVPPAHATASSNVAKPKTERIPRVMEK